MQAVTFGRRRRCDSPQLLPSKAVSLKVTIITLTKRKGSYTIFLKLVRHDKRTVNLQRGLAEHGSPGVSHNSPTATDLKLGKKQQTSHLLLDPLILAACVHQEQIVATVVCGLSGPRVIQSMSC